MPTFEQSASSLTLSSPTPHAPQNLKGSLFLPIVGITVLLSSLPCGLRTSSFGKQNSAPTYPSSIKFPPSPQPTSRAALTDSPLPNSAAPERPLRHFSCLHFLSSTSCGLTLLANYVESETLQCVRSLRPRLTSSRLYRVTPVTQLDTNPLRPRQL